MNPFKSKYTKWIPFGNYSHATNDYIIFVRKNLRNNMLSFKTKRVQAWIDSSNCAVPYDLIDVKKAWIKIQSMEGEINEKDMDLRK